MSKKLSKPVFGKIISLIILLVLGLKLINKDQSNTDKANPEPSKSASLDQTKIGGEINSLVTRVIDGDTIEVNLNGQLKTIRLLGLDTPESVDPRQPVECFGKEASNKTKSLVEGKIVRLEADQTQANIDKYGRLLRYVFLFDGTNVNKLLIAEGYAFEYTYETPYKYQADFKAAEKEARELKKGLWADEACQ